VPGADVSPVINTWIFDEEFGEIFKFGVWSGVSTPEPAVSV
jgi:hypothetical protein